jgi:DMSO/TMAO reductase YedYZ molybdopterin-dependent catalytic subunit
VPGGEWGNGAMGNAMWTGITLKSLLARVGVLPGAMQVRFSGLDTGEIPETPVFMKSLAIDHATDGEVMVAYGMNGSQFPLLNGFPLRLVVPGWYSTYWVKMLSHIEVLDKPDDNFWMHSAYLIPDTPGGTMAPGDTSVRMIPINRMVPRSFITNLQDNATVQRGVAVTVRGIAFGGDTGVKSVTFSADGGTSWQNADLGKDYGRYGFRRWHTSFVPKHPGMYKLMVKATNSNNLSQPTIPTWNTGGYMRNVIEEVTVRTA